MAIARTHNRHVAPGERAANVGFEIMKCLIDEVFGHPRITLAQKYSALVQHMHVLNGCAAGQ
eukprot:5167850-Amphidinium_carterae.1